MDPKSVPAFPCEWDYINSNRESANGMNLRDYFAAKAMQALVSVHAENDVQARWGAADTTRLLAGAAYLYADAMLKAREA